MTTSATKPIHLFAVCCLLVVGMFMRLPIAYFVSVFINEALMLSDVTFQTTTVFWWAILGLVALVQSSDMSPEDELLMKHDPGQLILQKTATAFGQWGAWIFILGVNYLFLTLWF